jgi:glycosyltransferase involved in cell wall biosynthesis
MKNLNQLSTQPLDITASPSLSVVIIACNEERGVAEVLEAAQPIADEIIFVDSGSTDRTVEIAQSYGVKLYHQPWLGYGAQKNLAINYATCDWILSLDADEVMTPELVQEIQAILNSDLVDKYNGFTIPRMLYIGDCPVRHGGFYPDAHLRLFRCGKGKFKERLVHESLVVDGPIGKLKYPLKNKAYDTVAEYKASLENFARLHAQQKLKEGYSFWQIHSLNELLHPYWTFFYKYIIRCGFMDGKLGLGLALIYSNYVRCKIRYLREAISSERGA